MVPSTGYPYWMFQAFARQNGQDLMSPDGTRTNFTRPDVSNALQYWVDLGRKHNVMPAGTVEWGTLRQNFIEGKTAMMWHTTGNLTAVKDSAKFPFGVAMLPASKQPGSPTGGGEFDVFKKSTPAGARGRVPVHQVDHRPRARRRLVDRHRLRCGEPGRVLDAEAEELTSPEFPPAAVARDQFKFATPELSTFQTGRVRKALDDAIQASLTTQKTPAEALKTAGRIGEAAQAVQIEMRHVYGWLLLTPAAILLVGFTHYPAIATLADSFFSSRHGAAPVALRRHRQLRRARRRSGVLASSCNNFWFALGTIPTSIALALLMALWVNARLPGRALVRLSYFTPTVLPMIAVANLWLYFYTPQIGLLDKVTGLFGAPSHNWLGNPDTVMGCVIAMTIWKEAGFFMIFYLAALQTLPPELEEAGRIEGASRGYFFWRVTFPLLMPTTLFVLVNATINSFKLVDHLIHIDQGRPRQRLEPAPLLRLPGGLQLPRLGVRRHANRRAARHLGTARGGPVPHDRAPSPLRMSTVEKIAAWLLAILWISPLLYAFWAAFHPPEFATTFQPFAPLTLANFEKAWGYAPFRATS